jgi:hypothetical protein
MEVKPSPHHPTIVQNKPSLGFANFNNTDFLSFPVCEFKLRGRLRRRTFFSAAIRFGKHSATLTVKPFPLACIDRLTQTQHKGVIVVKIVEGGKPKA